MSQPMRCSASSKFKLRASPIFLAMSGKSKLAMSRLAIRNLVEEHFVITERVTDNPGKGGRKRNVVVEEEGGPEAGAFVPEGAPATSRKKRFVYKCKHCPDFAVKDVSNSRALEHILLANDAHVKLCVDPQITSAGLTALHNAGVAKASSFLDRLAAHTAMGRVAATQPAYDQPDAGK